MAPPCLVEVVRCAATLLTRVARTEVPGFFAVWRVAATFRFAAFFATDFAGAPAVADLAGDLAADLAADLAGEPVVALLMGSACAVVRSRTAVGSASDPISVAVIRARRRMVWLIFFLLIVRAFR